MTKPRISGGKFYGNKLRLIKKYWFGGKCMFDSCDKTVDLEFAHTKETPLSKKKKSGRSSQERLKDVMKYPERILLFCSEHHRIFDGRTKDEWPMDFYSGF